MALRSHPFRFVLASSLALAAAVVPSSEAKAAGPAAPRADQLGHICYDSGAERQIRPEDALWLARMVDGETWGKPTQADAEAMLWSIAQRSAIWGFPKWDFSRIVWSYSQPISPYWTRTGSKCAKYHAAGYKGAIPDRCSVRRVNKREENRVRPWSDIHPVARQAVVDFAAGRLDNPVPGSVGWWAPGAWKSREKSGANKSDHMTYAAEIDGNVYFEMFASPDTRGWDKNVVTVVGPGEHCPMVLGDHRGGGSKPAGKADAKPSLGSCASGYGYHKTGKIASWSTRSDGTIDSLTLESTGWSDRVCDDASGMIYRGGAYDRYVEDGSGQKIRFAATKVEANRTVVKITHGTLRPTMLDGNRRIVIRNKK